MEAPYSFSTLFVMESESEGMFCFVLPLKFQVEECERGDNARRLAKKYRRNPEEQRPPFCLGEAPMRIRRHENYMLIFFIGAYRIN